MLDIQVYEQGGIQVVRLVGELNATLDKRFEETMERLSHGSGLQVALDMSGLKSLDSAGLSELIHFVTRARLTEGRVVLVAPSPFVAGVLNVTRLDRWFDICGSLAEAEETLQRA